MKVVRCKNNHFFDVDSYSVCPHCGEPAGDVSTVSHKTESGHKKGFFWSRNKNSEEKSTTTGTKRDTKSDKTESILERQDIIQEAVGMTEADDMPMRPSVPQTPVQQVNPQGQPQSQMMNGQSVMRQPESALVNPQSQMMNGQPGISQSAGTPVNPQGQPKSQVMNGQPAMRQPVSAQVNPQSQMMNGQPVMSQSVGTPANLQSQPQGQTGAVNPNGTAMPNISQQVNNAARPQTSGLRQAIQQASANTEGKTMSYFSAAVAGNTAAKNNAPSEPVVGWLVCIKGEHFGESFQIYAGRNSIGRAADNRIVMSKDNSVSRSKHAFVIYEPKKHHFFVQPGDSSGLTYLNDEYISEMKEIKAFDSIELGESVLKFVPLCGDNFNWDEYITERG